jgi:membrane protein YdbS with pleckstrin-like domain
LTWLWWSYDDWRNDVYTVTKDRIIDVMKRPLFFAEERREAPIGKIESVNVKVPGPFAYLLGYGNVTIQTAAETGQFSFTFVANPRAVQAEILRRVEAVKEEQAARDRAQRQSDMAIWFEAYHRIQREQ